MIPNPDKHTEHILEPLSKMTKGNKKHYIADVRVMNYLLQAIPNEIYNSVDTCKNTKDMWEQIKRLMYGSDVTSHVRHSRLMDEFDKFAAKEGESLESVYERLTTLVNIMDRNNIRPILVSINTKFLNFLQPEWSKYVTMFSTPTNNRLCTSSNTRNQAVIQDGRVDIQTKNAGYGGNGHYARDCQKPRVHDALYFREQMLLAMKDEAGSNLKDKENDFMLDNSYGDETLEELTAAVIMMAQIQLANDNAESEPSYDAKAVSEVNASNKVHEKVNHVKCKTIIHTSDDDQTDSNIIFDDPYVENNVGTSEHDSHDHDEYHDIKMLAYNVQREAENQIRLNNELKKQKNCYKRSLRHLRIGSKPGLGYKNPERLKKAIAAQPKMYHYEILHSTNLKIDSPDSEETLEDVEASRLKMRNKMVQLNYGKLNALYETFVPQQEPFVEQTYFSFPSTSNDCSESKEVTSDLLIPKIPKKSKLLKMFEKMDLAIHDLRKRIDVC
ncbi:hypothetical protein Tco_0454719 [Tanacetum coccineum]